MHLKYVRVNEINPFASVFNENKSENNVSFIFARTQQVAGTVSEILSNFNQTHAIAKLSLDFSHHGLEENDIKALARFLESDSCPSSIEIVLTSTNLEIRYLAILSQVIANSCKAESVSLNIANNRLGDACISVLSGVFISKNAPTKLSLNLASNLISDDGVGELSEFIKCRTSNIRDLSVNLLFNKTSETGSLILVQTLKSLIEKVKFKINYEFGKHGIEIIRNLADAIRLRKSATAISLQFGVQHLTIEEIEIIFDALTQISRPQQIELDLSEQGLGDAGFIAMLDKINRISSEISLRLYLIFNSIKGEGARALQKFIKNNALACNLFLDVSQNAFGGDAGKSLIIQAINENPEIFAHLSLVGPTQEITTICESKKNEILAMTNNHGLR